MNSSNKFLISVVIVIILVLGGAGFYILKQNQKAQIPNPQANQNKVLEDNKKLISEIGKLINLPFGEDPTVATVSDVSKLNNQPFFKNAQNGDKVLIYPIAKKAFLYSVTQKKVLDVAPFNVGTPSAQAVSSASPSAKITPKPTPK